MRDQVGPPAIIHEHIDVEQCRAEVAEGLALAKEGERKGVQWYAFVGDRLLKIKQAVGVGAFGPWLAANFAQSARHARRYMRLAKTDTGDRFEEAWRVVCGKYDEADDDKPQDDKPKPKGRPVVVFPEGYIFCRFHRLRPSKRKLRCKDCEALNREPGDDTSSEEEAKRENRRAKARQGQAGFVIGEYEKAFGVVARMPDAIQKAYPDTPKTETAAVLRLLEELAKFLQQWKKRHN